MRTEFGVFRTNCSCRTCLLNYQVMPGFLIPSDLDRIIPQGADPFLWAETNLLASPGATALKDGEIIQIPTLVPAIKEDRSCKFLSTLSQCTIHEIAPFGCAFFDCGPEVPGLSAKGIMEVYKATRDM